MPTPIGWSGQTSGGEVAEVAEIAEIAEVRTAPALVLELGIVLLVVLVVLLALRRIIVRAKGRVAADHPRRRAAVDPWTEAGRRLEVAKPPENDPAGPLQ